MFPDTSTNYMNSEKDSYFISKVDIGASITTKV